MPVMFTDEAKFTCKVGDKNRSLFWLVSLMPIPVRSSHYRIISQAGG